MSALIYAIMALTILVVGGMIAAMTITALEPRYVPPALRGLQRRMQTHMAPEWVRNQPLDAQGHPLEEDGLAIFDSLVVQESDPVADQFGQVNLSQEAEIPAHALTMTDTATLPQGEALLFLRAEIGVQLGFDLDIRGTTVNMTSRQYRRLRDYTGLAFDTVETPESYLGRHGITAIHLRSNRPGRGNFYTSHR